MSEDGKGSVSMVLVGIGLGALYWFIDSFLSLFLSNNFDIFSHLFSPDQAALYRRLVVICLLVIFGSHCQTKVKLLKKEVAEWIEYSQLVESKSGQAAESAEQPTT